MIRLRFRGRNGEDVHCGGEGEQHKDLRGSCEVQAHGSGGRRPRGPPLQPRQALLPEAEVHEARPRRVLHRRRGGGGQPAARAARDDEALRRRRQRRVLLPEAGAEGSAGLAADRDLHLPERRTATELVANDAAHLVWAVNLGVVDFNPHPVRRADLDRPDELRVDLDPMPGVRWNTVRKVAMCVKEVLEEHGLVGFPKTSGSRGIHVNVRIEPRWDYIEVRRAALALAREVERRLPKNATSKWWKEERHGVFVDYNQNARDRTIASGYSVRPVPDARVCCPLEWERGPGRGAGGAAARHRAEPASEEGGSGGGHRRARRARSTSCSISRAATRRAASATRPGRRTSPSSAASPSECSRAVLRRSPDVRQGSRQRPHP